MIHRLIKVISKSEMSERRRKMIHRLIEGSPKHMMSERERKKVHGLIKAIPKHKMSERRGKGIDVERYVEFVGKYDVRSFGQVVT